MQSNDYLDDPALHKLIREKIAQGAYRIRVHARGRLEQREVNLLDVLYVLEYGVHEKEKTLYDLKHQTWKYAIRGKTEEAATLRVIIAFYYEMFIITVIKL